MPFYKKKPIIVEAARVTERTLIPAQQTLHGHDLVAEAGEWIVKGVKEEYYPCRDDIFRASYSPVNGEAVKHMLVQAEAVEAQIDSPMILAHPLLEAFNKADLEAELVDKAFAGPIFISTQELEGLV